MERTIDEYTLDLTIIFSDRDVDVCLHDPRSLAETMDMLLSIVEQYPQAASFVVDLVRVSHTIEENPVVN